MAALQTKAPESAHAVSHTDARQVTVDVDELLSGAAEAALHPVLRLLPAPWASARVEDLQICPMSGAMTNLVYRCALVRGGAEEAVVLARIHANRDDGDPGDGDSKGTEGNKGSSNGCALFDRAEEVATFSAVSRAGLGPLLLLLFRNGRIEEFLVEYVTLSAHDLPDPGVSTAIAAAMASFHTRVSDLLGTSAVGEGAPPPPVLLWQRLRSWLAIAERVWGREGLEEWLGAHNLAAEIDALEASLTTTHPVWVAVCHNDLQYGNIMALAPTYPGDAQQQQQQDAVQTQIPFPAVDGVSALIDERRQRAERVAAALEAGGSHWLMDRLAADLTHPGANQPNNGCSDCGSPLAAAAPAGAGPSFTSTGGSDAGDGEEGRQGRARLLLPSDGGEPRLRGQSPERKRGHSPPLRRQFSGGGYNACGHDHEHRGGDLSHAPPLHLPMPPSAVGHSHPRAGPCSDGASTDYPSNISTRGGTTTPAGAATRVPSAFSSGAGAPPHPLPDPIRLIDYEYAGTAPIAFDVANHWCEWAADYHSDTPSVLDFGRLPRAGQRAAFVEAYARGLLEALGLETPSGDDDSSSSSDDVHGGGGGTADGTAAAAAAAAAAAQEAVKGPASAAVLHSVWAWLALHHIPRGGPVTAAAFGSLTASLGAAARAYESVSHLQWALWGVVQAKESAVDFDYRGYAEQRWAQWLATKGRTGL